MQLVAFEVIYCLFNIILEIPWFHVVACLNEFPQIVTGAFAYLNFRRYQAFIKWACFRGRALSITG